MALGAFALLAISSPYRMERLTAFLNPWADPFNSGFQLTQALIAFGRGEWFGVGLGASVQKLFYLPEAHTDFVYAVLAEELGTAGASVVVLLFVLLIARIFRIGRNAAEAGLHFGAHLCYGTALWFAMQAFINMGVNMGLLPTKGLTLPLMSYGGSSIVVMCVSIALVLRVSLETPKRGVTQRRAA
jgi:cell division protein FtsW